MQQNLKEMHFLIDISIFRIFAIDFIQQTIYEKDFQMRFIRYDGFDGLFLPLEQERYHAPRRADQTDVWLAPYHVSGK